MDVRRCAVCNEQGHSSRKCRELFKETEERPVPYVETGGYRDEDGEEDALSQRWVYLYHVLYIQPIHQCKEYIPC
jgi:hypothetical protein